MPPVPQSSHQEDLLFARPNTAAGSYVRLSCLKMHNLAASGRNSHMGKACFNGDNARIKSRIVTTVVL